MDHFATTHWSVVLAAGEGEDDGQQKALTTLCELYWYPLYAFVRRKGYDYHEAHELTQSFFERMLEKKYLKVANPERGRFRSFLLASLKHFLANEWDRRQALKRGGGRTIISLDIETAEGRYVLEPSHNMTPEMIFERRWALTLLETVLKHLEEDLEAAGKRKLFDCCSGMLVGGAHMSYREVAASLDMTEGAVKVAVHRLRRRFRELLHTEIADTVRNPDDVEEELRHLISVLGSSGTP